MKRSKKCKIAFVVQRCGEEVNGGAETLCLKTAEHMSALWEIDILTTCALDYMTWRDHYPPGSSESRGPTIHRFRVDEPRDVDAFDRISAGLQGRLALAPLDEQERWMHLQGPVSSGLKDFIERHRDDYDAFFFFTYLYATTYFLLPIVQEKAWLVPLAHDEWPIYLGMWNKWFERPRGFIFSSQEEKAFLKSRFPECTMEGPIAGMAVDPPEDIDSERFRRQFNIQEPFLLYIGRIDPSKGCEVLFNHFLELRNREKDLPRKLILLGRPSMPIPEHPDILSLGFVDEQVKWDALAASDVLVMPSPYESLSIVLLEAWSLEKPVLVNSKCDVLVGQCRRAQGGLWYDDFEEFRVALEFMTHTLRSRLGKQGKAFVKRTYSWEAIARIYEQAIG